MFEMLLTIEARIGYSSRFEIMVEDAMTEKSVGMVLTYGGRLVALKVSWQNQYRITSGHVWSLEYLFMP